MLRGLLVILVFGVGAAVGYGIRGAAVDTAPVAVSGQGLNTASTTGLPTAITRGLSLQNQSPQPNTRVDETMEIVQQRTGTICQTSVGTCTVPPQDINSPCRCGDYVGQIVR